ncbi:MAG: CDP-glucose 4,6-dehydratase [Candidatus Magasanikbacteria bacterium CG10_big_fil_rev_8_21_14_0_10_36_32]|uniref:CDP-glucose 4,6-dehydratase n=1 Tax=Candidatus Magasanikbacteria bacterium CG10_big_fil_rev_8_21_14_0_10_36_32 TaxID=1974646 RepID=A0A2M6W5Q7_9BACT|nr:MAG: CDP-glucose 4,6-dehydratase [Candidatus Magasanikbacteria bacterium CG10_big_fil_rev_8_21_14_0_10_36_32]
MQNFYKNKKVLITGHSGFKGSWLAQILVNWGADVIGISLPPDTKPSLFEVLKLSDRIKKNYFVDIRDFQKLKEIFETEKPEIVFHLAAQPLVRDSYDDPLKTHSTNVIGTANILQVIKEFGGVKSAVIITTDKVYENKERDYSYKETDALGGYDPYSASKAAADIVTNSYIQSFFNPNDFGSKHNTLIAVARAGNVIGGGDWAKDRLVPDMIKAIFEKKEALVIRNPKAVRPWQHVFEPLRGYLMLGQYLYNGETNKSGAWNFGPCEEDFVSVEHLIKEGILILGTGNYNIVEDNSKHEANLLKLNINKAATNLNWFPKWVLKESLKATFEWYGQFCKGSEKMMDITDQQINLYFSN